MNRLLTATAALAVVAGATTAQGAVVADFQFNTVGDAEGWHELTASEFDGSLTSDGQSLVGTITSGDPKLIYNEPGGIDRTAGAAWTTMEFRIRVTDSTTGVVPLTSATFDIYRLDGTFGPDPTVVASGDGFYTMTFDISYFNGVGQGSDGNIGLLRIDPVGGASFNGATIEVDYIQVSDDSIIPEPGSLALLGLGLGLIARRRRASI